MSKPYKLYYCDLLSFYLFILFTVSCFFYFQAFSFGNVLDYEPVPGFFYPVNTHDHLVYFDNFRKIISDNLSLSINNNIGIAYIYYFLYLILSAFLGDVSIYYLSFWFNVIVLLFCFFSYRRIILEFGFKSKVSLTFFFLTFLIYFSQLINKDALTILISLQAVLYLKNKSVFKYFLLVVFSFFVRFQLPAFLFLCWFLSHGKKNHLFILIGVYIFLSLINGFLSKYQTHFLSQSTLGSGLSYLVFSFNQKYYIGSLLFNPFRVVQYFQDYYKSILFVMDDGIDVSRLKNIPHLIYFTFILPYLIRAYLKYPSRMKTDMKYLLSVGVSFFLIWLFNPTINSRYFICFLPIFQIIALYEKSLSKK